MAKQHVTSTKDTINGRALYEALCFGEITMAKAYLWLIDFSNDFHRETYKKDSAYRVKLTRLSTGVIYTFGFRCTPEEYAEIDDKISLIGMAITQGMGKRERLYELMSDKEIYDFCKRSSLYYRFKDKYIRA